MAIYVTRTGVALTVGIIVLTGLLIGGLFFVKNTSEQARRDEAIAVAEQQLEKESSGVASNGDTSSQTSGTDGAGGRTGQGGSSESADMLPETGPAETTVSILGAGVIVFAGASYYRSRQTLLEAR